MSVAHSQDSLIALLFPYTYHMIELGTGSLFQLGASCAVVNKL